jgi:hypothetical protein
MKITEKPIQTGKLAELRELTGGHKGVVFLLENTDSEKLVVKFQNETPAEALAGTRIMKHAGAETPAVRQAASIDIAGLSLAIATVRYQFPDIVSAFNAAKNKFKYVILMEFAEGSTLKYVREKELHMFLQVICNQDFQFELGKIVAADAFAGNPDRMFAAKVGFKGAVEGWYHEQNLFVSSKGKPVAIDNAFSPKVVSGTLPWGRYLGGFGVQWGSIASAYKDFAQEEAGVLFDKFLATAAKDHDSEVRAIDDARTNRAAFVDNFTRGATQAMQSLLTRGQQWNKSLSDCDVGETLLREFRVRKRLLRQVSKGVDPKAALERANNDEEYRKWVLTSELGFEGDADELLKKGVSAYKQFKALRRTNPST